MIILLAAAVVTIGTIVSIGLRIVPQCIEEMRQIAIEEGVYLDEEKWRWIEIRMLFTWPLRVPFNSITNHALFRLFLDAEKEQRREERERAYLSRT